MKTPLGLLAGLSLLAPGCDGEAAKAGSSGTSGTTGGHADSQSATSSSSGADGTTSAGSVESSTEAQSSSGAAGTIGADDTSGDVTSTGDASSTGEPLPCGIDCATIETSACEVATCDEAARACVVGPADDGLACDDGLFCTLADTCEAGVCTGGPANECDLDVGACAVVSCDEKTETCDSASAPDDTPCPSANLCEQDSTCQAGECTAGTVEDCADAEPAVCHVSVCNPGNGMCEEVVVGDGDPCVNEADLCSTNNTCFDGVCGDGQPVDCSGLDEDCLAGACDPLTGGCGTQPSGAGDPCAAATDDCNVGTCDMDGQCIAAATNEGGACDDGSSCTINTTCTAGTCGGGLSTVTTYFSEDFSSNAAGWSLDTEWEIGPAVASPSTTCGTGDPSMDASASADNGIAGVVLGGSAAQAVHSHYYLTSPPIDTSTVPGAMILSFQRWLNSDYAPFMENQVAVWDGTFWVTVWESGPSPGVQDASWTPQSLDITAYKNSVMRVRFGFEVGSSRVFECSGWNVDDVLISNAACF